MRSEIVLRGSVLALALLVSLEPALGQTPGTITAPILNILDFSGDTEAFPLLQVQGGTGSSTLGIEATSQSITSTGSLPPLSSLVTSGLPGNGNNRTRVEAL